LTEGGQLTDAIQKKPTICFKFARQTNSRAAAPLLSKYLKTTANPNPYSRILLSKNTQKLQRQMLNDKVTSRGLAKRAGAAYSVSI
jgi:hypothetical protein